jgi:RAB protein geranylgeranyltransferase component A
VSSQILQDTISELTFWENFPPKEMENYSKRYNIDLHPKLIFSESDTCRKMILANIDKYMDFSVLYGISLFDPLTSRLIKIPTNKSDIFKHKNFSTQEKREIFHLLKVCTSIYER